MSKYSDVKNIGRFQYRYNYETSKLEQLGKTVRKITDVDGQSYPAVVLDILHSIDVKKELFEKEPDYWMQLFDSQFS